MATKGEGCHASHESQDEKCWEAAEGGGHLSSSLCRHLLSRFQFIVFSRAVAKAFSTWHKKTAGKHRLRRGTVTCPCCPGGALAHALVTTAHLKGTSPRGCSEELLPLPGTQGCPGKLLQRQVKLSLPVLPNQGPGRRQQDTDKKPSAR